MNYINQGYAHPQGAGPPGHDNWLFAPGPGGPARGGGGHVVGGRLEDCPPIQQLLPPYPQKQTGQPPTFDDNSALAHQANRWLNATDVQDFLQEFSVKLPSQSNHGQSSPLCAPTAAGQGAVAVPQRPEPPQVQTQLVGSTRSSRFQAAVEAAPAGPPDDGTPPSPKDFPWIKKMAIVYLWYEKIVLQHPIDTVTYALGHDQDPVTGKPLDHHGRLDLEIIRSFYTLVPRDDVIKYRTNKRVRAVMNKGQARFRSMLSNRCRNKREDIFAKSAIAPYAGRPVADIVTESEWSYLIGYDTTARKFTATEAIPPMLFELDSNGHLIPGTEFRVECVLNCLKLTFLGANSLSGHAKLVDGRKNIAQKLDMIADASVIALGGLLALFTATSERFFTEVGADTDIDFGETLKTYNILVDLKLKAQDPGMLRTLDYFNEHLFGKRTASTASQSSSSTPATDQVALRAQRFAQAARSAGAPSLSFDLGQPGTAQDGGTPLLDHHGLASDFAGLTTRDNTIDGPFSGAEVDVDFNDSDYAVPAPADDDLEGTSGADVGSSTHTLPPLLGILKPSVTGAHRSSGNNVVIDVERNETLIISARPYRAQSQDAEGEDDDEVEVIEEVEAIEEIESEVASSGSDPAEPLHSHGAVPLARALCPLCDAPLCAENLSALFRTMLHQALEHSIKTPRATNPDGVSFLEEVPSPHPVCIRHAAEPSLLEHRAHPYPDIDWDGIEKILRSSAFQGRLSKLVAAKGNTRGKNLFWKAYLTATAEQASSIESLGLCGYYGERGQIIIAKVLKDMFPVDSIAKVASPATPEDYHRAVLVPTAVQLLVADAMKSTQAKAYEIMGDSNEWGLQMYPGGEEDGLWYTEAAMAKGTASATAATAASDTLPTLPSQTSNRPKPRQALRTQEKSVSSVANNPSSVPSQPTGRLQIPEIQRSGDHGEIRTPGALRSTSPRTDQTSNQGQGMQAPPFDSSAARVVTTIDRSAAAPGSPAETALPSAPPITEHDMTTAKFARSEPDAFKSLLRNGVLSLTPGLKYLLLSERQQAPSMNTGVTGGIGAPAVLRGHQALGLGHPSSRPSNAPRHSSHTYSSTSTSSLASIAPVNRANSGRIVSDSAAALGNRNGSGSVYNTQKLGAHAILRPPGANPTTPTVSSSVAPPRSLNNGPRNGISNTTQRQQTPPVIRSYSATQVLQKHNLQHEAEDEIARSLREIDEAPLESDEDPDAFDADEDYVNSTPEGCY
ncbi:hypothetical protein CYLTODRAFT_494041 [Cylindrobasidium torrendii FP15055 ss-10]|uniref:Restriction of telomere capping protein 4 n=1 Tax=Cylindrobasidium torrendii FP15055 ss-10 TaxID=1314674 RepID=A0A0D7AZ70_9AGAR|nr:hypothetical protein CYLTODRAFT_494041 [Cylindrobasidium torrendii FP15055 ss-10]